VKNGSRATDLEGPPSGRSRRWLAIGRNLALAPLAVAVLSAPPLLGEVGPWAAGVLRAQEEPEPPPVDVYADVPTSTAPSLVTALGVVGPGDRDRRARVAMRMGEVVVTVGEIEDHLWTSPPHVRDAYRTPEGRREILQQLARRHLLAREAERRGVVTEAIRFEALRRQEGILGDLLELMVRSQAVAAREGEPAPAPPEAVPEERFAVVLRTASRDAAARWARESVGRSFDQVLAGASELGEGEQTPWARADAESTLEAPLREALWRLPETGATSSPIRLPGGRYGVVFFAGRTGGYVPEAADAPTLAILRGDEAMASLVAQVLAEHARDVRPEGVDGVAFRMPRERSIEAMEAIAREREQSAAEAAAGGPGGLVEVAPEGTPVEGPAGAGETE
jgi:hypothetical protein